MALFDYHLNPLYPIKECSSCGALYTTDYCCSDGSLRDKIICDLNKTPDLSQRPPQNCHLFTYCIESGIFQDFQDTSEPSNDNTNVFNALQEPFVVKQDLGENSSQSLPQINHHCCYGCGDSLEDVFCHQCTCELCGKGAHYGYNCPPKVSIIPDLEPFNNQTIDELPQTLPSFDPTYYSEDGNSFTYDSRSNLVDDSPNVFNPPLQPPTYSYEFCGNDSYCSHDCPLQVPFTYDPEAYYNQDFNFPQNFQIFQQQYLCCTRCGGPHETCQCDQLIFDEPYCENFRGPHMSFQYEFIKSSVENLVLIPSESEGIPDNMCDVPFHDNYPPLNISKDQFKDFSDSNDDSTLIDDASFSIDDIEYVEASPPDSELVSLEVMEIVIPKVGGIDADIVLTFKDDILREKLLNINLLFANIEALKDNLTPSSDFVSSGSESHPLMLNKENYIPWSSRLLRYAKSRPNGKLIHNSILNGPYVRKIIPKPGDANRDINITETSHLQTGDELSDKELK
uniref:Uncharacterized protein n=1 Tax=Tanacetum cinerariifolium TaxID=118510 RepID=A0A6L2LHF7_TANCI|nr:hypothetical protein [Tanacetum cinerariifolium]